VRFQRLLRDLPASDGVGWAALAARHGYADQAHLIRDFRELTGRTPARFLAEPRDLSDLFTGRRRAGGRDRP
jgi:AraC-like DNA-binding protein